MASGPVIEGQCHCGAIRFVLKSEPEWLTVCNCSLCRRIGGLWAAADTSAVDVSVAGDALNSYEQGDRTLRMHACRRCGCTTHYTPTDPAVTRMKVNLAMAEPDAIAHYRIRRFDGANSWTYLD